VKKAVIAIVVGLVIVAGAAAAFMQLQGKSDKDATADTSTSESSDTKQASNDIKSKKACELITLADAKTLIGDNAALLEGSGTPNAATTADVSVDNCSYSADGATLGDMKQIVIQVHTGESAEVKQAYDNYKKDYPGDPLPELGSTAYYATETKQVNVLKGNSWFFVGAGSINGEGEPNKALAIKSAETALGNL
jgi:hypothetical protein